MKSEKRSKTIANSKTRKDRKPRTVGASVIQGLKEAIAWSKGKNDAFRGVWRAAALLTILFHNKRHF
jgi:hypothetical protein